MSCLFCIKIVCAEIVKQNVWFIIHIIRNNRPWARYVHLLVFVYHIKLYEIVLDQYVLNYDLLTVAKTYFTTNKVSK